MIKSKKVNNFTVIKNGVYTELGSVCSMLGIVKLANSMYRDINYFYQLSYFNSEIGSKRKLVFQYEKEVPSANTFHYDFKNNWENKVEYVNNDNKPVPCVVIDDDYRVTTKLEVGGSEEIELKDVYGIIHKEERSLLYRDIGDFNKRNKLIPLDKETFEFKNKYTTNRFSNKSYTLDSIISNSSSKYLEYEVRIESVSHPGNDCIINRFCLPFLTNGNIIGLNKYNLFLNKDFVNNNTNIENNTNSSTTSAVIIKSNDNIEDVEKSKTYKNLVKEVIDKLDVPHILLEDSNVMEFRKQLRNLDRGKMLFHLHLDEADCSTGISNARYLYKDSDNIASVIRPIVISDNIIESLVQNLELIDLIQFAIKDVETVQSNLKATSHINWKSYFTISNSDNIIPTNLAEMFLTKSIDYTNMVEYCSDVVMPYLFKQDDETYYNTVRNGILTRSKLMKWSNRNHVLGMWGEGDKNIEEYKRSIKKFFTPIKEIEYRTKNKILETIRSNGIRYNVSNYENPNNLLEFILNKLNNKIIIIEFKKVNLDEKYEDSRRSSTFSSLYKYYTRATFDNDEIKLISSNLKELREKTRGINFDFYSNIGKENSIRPIGGTFTSKFTDDNNTVLLEADGYYCSLREQGDSYSTSVFRSFNYFKTTFIDTIECELDTKYPIMYEENIGILFYRVDKENLNNFLTMAHPRLEDRTKYTSGEFFEYIGDGPILYRVVSGEVHTLKPKHSNIEAGLYRTVYQDGNIVIDRKIILPSDYKEFNITTSLYIANDIAKFQKNNAGVTNAEIEDNMGVNKMKIIDMTMKERETNYYYNLKELKDKADFMRVSREIDLDNMKCKLYFNTVLGGINIKQKEAEYFIKKSELKEKHEFFKEEIKEERKNKKINTALNMITTAGKIIDTYKRYG